MDLYEYQARDVFEKHGVPVLRGITAVTPEEASAAAAELGSPVVVVKAQVKTGGRGKAGGVKSRSPPTEAAEKAEEILGLDIKGHMVQTVMIAEGADIAEEYYFSLLLDRANRSYLAMCSKEGGMEIEQLAVERPGGAGQDPGRPERRHRPGQGRRDRRRSRLRRRRRRRDRPGAAAARQGVRGRGRHPGRGEPAGEDRRRARSSRWTARSRWTRTPTSGTPTTPSSPTSPRRTRWRRRPRPRA